VDTYLEEGVEPSRVQRWVQAASILHSDGDAMDIAVVAGRMAGVRGRAVDRVNRGRLGPKDLFGWQANASADRLTRPLVRQGGRLVECDWDTAMERIVARSRELLEERGPGSIGFYTTGQLFLEEYYTLAVLARAGIGTNHLDGNTRLCTSTAAEALKESFGCGGQPGSYDDIDHADVIALFGHNTRPAFCASTPAPRRWPAGRPCTWLRASVRTSPCSTRSSTRSSAPTASTTTTSRRTRSASTNSPPGYGTAPPSGRPGSATCRPP
jgi:hypothetical protein